jgi:hypothetical protein
LVDLEIRSVCLSFGNEPGSVRFSMRIWLILSMGVALSGCGGTLEEENIDDGMVSSSETIQYDDQGHATVIEKKVDPMAPYGTDNQGIRDAEDMDLMGLPPE